MKKDVEELENEFRSQATKIFYSWFSRFETTQSEFRRKTNENVFQQKRAQYAYSLKEELEKLAISMIEKNQSIKEINHFKRNLTNRINEFVEEFKFKAETL